MGSGCSCCGCNRDLAELSINLEHNQDDHLWWVVTDMKATVGKDAKHVSSELWSMQERRTELAAAHHERRKELAAIKLASDMRGMLGAALRHAFNSWSDPVLLSGLVQVVLMSREVIDGARRQAKVTGEEFPPPQTLISMVLSVGCIAKQCIEEPRYRKPMGVGDTSLDLHDEDVLREAARYARFAAAAYSVTGATQTPQRIVDVFAADPWRTAGDGSGVEVLSFTCQHTVRVERSRRAMSIKIPSSFLAKDHLNGGALVLSIRGTLSTADAITDGVATPVHVTGDLFIEGYVHAGMACAASATVDKAGEGIVRFVDEQLRAHDAGAAAASLVLTGHSLGGGVAILVLCRLLNSNLNVRRACTLGLVKVYVFGAPASLALRPPGEWTGREVYLAALLNRGKVIWSFVNEFDPIPRVSVRSMLLLFVAALHVRLSQMQKLLYLRFGVAPGVQLADQVALLPLGEHAGHVRAHRGAGNKPAHGKGAKATEQKRKHVGGQPRSGDTPQAAAAAAPTNAAKRQSGSSLGCQRRRRSGPQLLLLWRKTVMRLLAWMRRFKRLMTPLHHVGRVFQIYRDDREVVHCQHLPSRSFDYHLLFHEGFAQNHLIAQYIGNLDAILRIRTEANAASASRDDM